MEARVESDGGSKETVAGNGAAYSFSVQQDYDFRDRGELQRKALSKPNVFSSIVGFMAAFWWPSGGDRHFVEVTKRWARSYPTSALIPKRALAAYGQDWQGVTLKVLPLPTTDRLGVSGTYILRAMLALPRLPHGREGMLAFSSSDALPDVLCGLLTKKWNRDTKWVGCVFHLIPLRTFEGKIDSRRLVPVFAQKVSHFLLNRWADMVLVDNSLLKEDLVRLGFRRGRVQVISLGVNRSFLDSMTPLPGRVYDGCFLARLHPSKGIFDLVDVWKTVTDRKPDARLAVVGGGPPALVEELEARIQRHGLQGNVSLLGFLPDPEAYRILKSSRVFLFPSKEEGWGISIAEAMTCGLPVVAYGLPHYSEIFPQGLITVPVGDVLGLAAAVLHVLDDEHKRVELGQQAREAVAQYDWEAVAQRELRLLESLFEGQPRTGGSSTLEALE